MKKEFSAWDEMINSHNEALNSGSDMSAAYTTTGRAVATADLKKIYDKTGNPNILHMRNSLRVDIGQTDNAMNDGFKLLPLSDSYDLVHDGILSLMASHDNGQDIAEDGTYDIEAKTVRHEISKKTWIDKALIGTMDEKAKEALYRDYESSPIQDSYKYVRKCIDSRGSVKTDPKSKYAYIEDEVDNTTVYRRMPKYYQYLDIDMTGTATGHTTCTPTMPNTDSMAFLTGKYHFVSDEKGKVKIGAETVTYTMTDFWTDIATELNLTEKQCRVLKLHYEGLGRDRIAAVLGVTESTIRKDLERICEKADSSGLYNVYLAIHGYNVENIGKIAEAERTAKEATDRAAKLAKNLSDTYKKAEQGLIKADSVKRAERRFNQAVEAKEKALIRLEAASRPCKHCVKVNGINWHTYKPYSHKIKAMIKPYMAKSHKADRQVKKADSKPIRFKLFERQLERQTARAEQDRQDRQKEQDRKANYDNALLTIDYDNFTLPKTDHFSAAEKSIYNWSYVLPFIPMDRQDRQTGQTDRTEQAEKASLKDCKWTDKEVAFWTKKSKGGKKHCPYEKEYWYINAKNLSSRMSHMESKRQSDIMTEVANITVRKWIAKHDCSTMSDIGFSRLCAYADNHNITF